MNWSGLGNSVYSEDPGEMGNVVSQRLGVSRTGGMMGQEALDEDKLVQEAWGRVFVLTDTH